ncbi:hypothetical protein [Aeromonas salmonicida]|uniref:hypothetical protein n=1 Tax=Aeromonas salmonicida TaxID=645 RepID=UPI001F4E52FF|nr:hypothetical protein [Aeromonas salmonicida]
MVLVKPVIHGLGINPESERATVDQRPVVLRPIGDGVKRFTHDADLRGMVVLRSLGFQLVPFKLHRFRKQRRLNRYSSSFRRPIMGIAPARCPIRLPH